MRLRHAGLPSSLKTNESVCTRSLNLYVSQHTRTGTLLAEAAMATAAVPTRDSATPLDNIAWAPSNTSDT